MRQHHRGRLRDIKTSIAGILLSSVLGQWALQSLGSSRPDEASFAPVLSGVLALAAMTWTMTRIVAFAWKSFGEGQPARGGE
jgi:hypothetical protein